MSYFSIYSKSAQIITKKSTITLLITNLIGSSIKGVGWGNLNINVVYHPIIENISSLIQPE